MRIPDLFLVGAPRSGTTSLYTYLKQHPDIYLSVLKEPHFFSSDLTRPPQATADWNVYLNLFADAKDEKRAGEGSVWYLESAKAPVEIKKHSPTARIIIMLRNPIDMIYSLHALYRRTGNEDLDFETALEAQQARRQGTLIPSAAYFPEGLQYMTVARYATKVERYYEIFGQHCVHTIIFDDFSQQTAVAIKRVFEFLDVDPNFEPELDLDKALAGLRFRAIKQMRRVPPEIREQMRGAQETHSGPPHRPMSSQLRLRLKAALAADITRLGKLLDRDLSHWA